MTCVPTAARVVLAACLCGAPALASAQQRVAPSPPTASVPADAATSAAFRRFAPAVARIEVLEQGSDAKAGVGSAFIAMADGRLVTNYHVISRLVQFPERHRARATLDGRTVEVRVLAVDVVHDLAVLSSVSPAPTLVFTPGDAPIDKGTRVLALGHPQDLGLAIVEGTYNGFVEHAAVPRLHYTGAINPGMSGGPAITDDGRLVGVNVSTMGDEVAFLVPAAAVRALLARTPLVAPSTAALRTQMAEQLRSTATAALGHLFAAGTATATLGAYRVPTLPDTTFRCWGDTDHPEKLRLEVIRHRCAMEDDIFLSESLSQGLVSFTHIVVRGPPAGSQRQFAAIETYFGGTVPFDGERREVTEFRCESANRKAGAFTWRTALCVRRLRDYPGIYEATFRAAVLGRREAGLVSTLMMSGVPFDLVKALPMRFLALMGSR